MEGHFKTLGWLFIVVGVLSLLLGLVLAPILVTMGREVGHQVQADLVKQKAPDVEIMRSMLGVMAAMWAFIGLIWLASSVASIINGWALLNRRPWARVLTIVLSILYVTQFPVGTAIGIYGLWAMFRSNAPLAWDEYVRGTQRTEMPAG